ncbi:uncharacterized protein [Trachinotus anak]|uniref:uncharacterized protein isoform X2 n=1 Tax=Trachinotus anak TaxID=443729 RepID=UPI0039F17CDF
MVTSRYVLCCLGNQWLLIHHNPGETTGHIKTQTPTQVYTSQMKRKTGETTGEDDHGPSTGEPGRDTGNGDRAQHLSGTRNNPVSSFGSRNEFGHRKLPPISTFLKTLPLNGGVRSETGHSGARATAGRLPLSGGLDEPQEAAGDPVHLAATSPSPSPVTSFTIPPTEEDVKQMQSVQDKNGHIKRPMNAFMVWSYIHRCVLRKACPGIGMIDTSVQLGYEWSKLTAEQKRPYFEVADKLKNLHKQQFPDYEFRPQKKKGMECLSSGWGTGQGEGQDPGVSSFVPQAIPPATPPAQSKLVGLNMCPCPILMTYTVGFHPCPSFCPYHAMGLYSRVQSHDSSHPNASSCLEEVRNYHNAHLPWHDTAVAAEHQPPDVSHEVLIETTTTSGSLAQPDIVTSNKVECKCEDDVDVIGLL